MPEEGNKLQLYCIAFRCGWFVLSAFFRWPFKCVVLLTTLCFRALPKSKFTSIQECQQACHFIQQEWFHDRIGVKIELIE